MKISLQTLSQYCLALLISLSCSNLFAQDEDLVISGSVDTYYTYDFSGNDNIGTSFADERNSAAIGMVDVKFEKTVDNVSFVGEIAFGPRAIGTAPGDVQNLYVSYAMSDQLSLTAGFMGTFVGYEVISPVDNFNYSGSYLFSNGPFQNAGLKLDYNVSDGFGIMVGLFQSQWDSYTSDPTLGVSELGAQIRVTPFDGGDIYLNYIGGTLNQEIDLTAGFQITDEFYLGLNVANRLKNQVAADAENAVLAAAAAAAGGSFEALEGTDMDFFGTAGYIQYAFSETFALGARYEYFAVGEKSTAYLSTPDSNVSAYTLSGNISLGPMTVIPEVRFESASEDIFVDSDAMPTSSAVQATVAAVFAF